MDADREAWREANTRAFLMTIRKCEGTAGDDGYRMQFGHTPEHPRLIKSYATHPCTMFAFRQTNGLVNYTSACGAFQFICVTWRRLRDKLKLNDFSPANQDLAAIELIREAGALPDVQTGRWDVAVRKCAGIWASLPGGDYPQKSRSWAYVEAAYREAGGMAA